MVLDMQWNESTVTDPEIATKTLCDEEEQFLFCFGNLSSHAIERFLISHSCNKFCFLTGISTEEKGHWLTQLLKDNVRKAFDNLLLNSF